jgi:hypothetical protein
VPVGRGSVDAVGHLDPLGDFERAVQLGDRNGAAGRMHHLLEGRGGVDQVEANVGRGLRFDAPALRERAGVDGVEAELVDQCRNGLLRVGVVSGWSACGNFRNPPRPIHRHPRRGLGHGDRRRRPHARRRAMARSLLPGLDCIAV